jgi:predicted nucleic acid-binding protein
VASVARKKALARPAEQASILAALERLGDLCIRLIDIEAAEVARLALRMRITAYDAAYLWLADRLGVPLVTLDRRLLSVFAGGRRRGRI